MEEYTQITLEQWVQWKEDIRQKLEETANNFVYIGYRLKQIRDSGMYGGAADIFDFARQEYGLSKSTVSRFIAINERYSEGGNSLELREEFRGFSSSKLSEMLTLSDSEIQLLTERSTVREIRELKQFSAMDPDEVQKEEESENPAEEAAGSADAKTAVHPVNDWARTPLEKCLIDFFRGKKETLNGVMECIRREPRDDKQAAELMAPSGQASHRKGIVFLFLYEWGFGVKYKLMTKPEPVSLTWKELLDIVLTIYGACDPADVWGAFYGKEAAGEKAVPAQSNQGNLPVATSQQTGEETDGEEEKEDGTAADGAGGQDAKETPDEEDFAPVPEDLKPYDRPPAAGRKSEADKWKEPKPERKPVELPPVDAVYPLPVGKSMVKDIRGGQRYMILKMGNPYRVGNTLRLEEQDKGETTGNVLLLRITHMTEDHSGIVPGYCVVQVDPLPEEEKELEGQMSFDDLEGNE